MLFSFERVKIILQTIYEIKTIPQHTYVNNDNTSDFDAINKLKNVAVRNIKCLMM